MGLQSLIRWLMPREDHFYDFVEKQAGVAYEAAVTLNTFARGARGESPYRDVTASSVRESVQEVEHRGDKLVHDMEEALAKTFVTPIDREDLQRLSSQLDDICDSANAAARACALMGVEKPTTPMMELMAKIVEGTDLLQKALPKLRKHEYAELIAQARGLRELEKSADVIFRDAISKLFHDPTVDAKVLLREREVLEYLEKAIDRCERVGETLTNLAIKNG